MMANEDDEDVGGPPPNVVPIDRQRRLEAAAATLLQRVRAARENREEFASLVWPDQNGNPIELQDFQRTWLRALDLHKRLYISGPRGHGKSETISIATPIYELGRNPNLRIKLIAQSDDKAKDRLQAIRQHLAHNDMLGTVFPKLRLAADTEDSKSKITVVRGARSKDPSIHAVGVMSAAVGARADLLIFDDIVDLKNAILQPQMRETIKAKVLGEWIPTLEPDGRIITVATPWTTSDANAYMRASPDFTVVETPVGTPEDPFAPIWPTYWPREKLMERYRIQGPVEYDRAYRLIALSQDTVPIQPGWIHYYDAETLGDPWALYCLVCTDLAISTAKGADFFAVVVLLYDPARNLIFVVDAWQARLSLREQAVAVASACVDWRPARVGVEFGGYQGAFAQYLTEVQQIPVPVWPFRTRGISKERRFIDHMPLFEGAKILFHPALNPNANPAVAQRGDIVSQILSFPLGRRDDLVDALAMGLQIIRESFPSGGNAAAAAGFETGEGIRTRVTVI